MLALERAKVLQSDPDLTQPRFNTAILGALIFLIFLEQLNLKDKDDLRADFDAKVQKSYFST